jgi:hypothetical protein
VRGERKEEVPLSFLTFVMAGVFVLIPLFIVGILSI